jgi:hypothetical protein
MHYKDFLSFDQTLALIKNVGSKRTILVMGENGIGKTSLHKALSVDPDLADYIRVPPIDCTQLSDGSLYMPDIDRERGVSRELPNERLGVHFANQRGAMNTRPVLGMFDEIGKIPQFVKNMIAPIYYERRVGTMYMPDNSIWFAATNLSVEGLSDFIEPHHRNRLVVVYMRKATFAEWLVNFAIPNKLNPILLACLEEHPEAFDSFIDYMEGGKYYGKDLERDNPIIFNPNGVQDAYGSPRSFHAASDILDVADKLDQATLEQALNGTVGKAFASLLMSFIRFGNQVPSSGVIKNDPLNAPIPSNKLAQQIVVFRTITQAKTRDDAEAFTLYIQRLEPEMQSLLCRRVSEADDATLNLFSTVTPFVEMLQDTRIYYKG